MTLIHSETHQDHQRWQSEIAQWDEDIQRWEDQHSDALAILEATFRHHIDALKKHAEQIGHHQAFVRNHERFIAECERSARPTAGDEENALAETHRDESKRHAGIQNTHEQLKRRHYQAIGKLMVLSAALNASLSEDD